MVTVRYNLRINSRHPCQNSILVIWINSQEQSLQINKSTVTSRRITNPNFNNPVTDPVILLSSHVV